MSFIAKTIVKTGIFFPVFFIFSFSAFCQQYAIKNYSVNDGLPQSQVFSIYQDNGGYLWLGTKGGGIVKFDGKKFTPAFPEQSVLFINKIESAGNKVYIAHTTGYSVFTQNNKEMSEPKNIINSNKFPVSVITPLNNDSVFIATTKGIYAGHFDNPSHLNFDVLEDDDVPGCSINFNNKIFFGNNYGLHELTITNGVCQFRLFNNTHGLKTHAVRCLANYKNSLLIGTYGGGLYRLFNNKITSLKIAGINDKEIVQCIFTDSQQNLWLGTNNGVIKLDKALKFQFRITEKEGLCRNNIVSIYEDDWSNIWFGSSGGGISRYSGQLFTNYNNQSGLPCKNVYAIAQSNDSSIWIGSTYAGLIQLKNGIINVYNQDHLFTNAKVKSLHYSSFHQKLFIGTEGEGLWIYDFTQFYKPENINTITGKWIKQITENENHFITIATAANGVILLDDNLNVIINLNKKKLLQTNRVNTVVQNKNQIWIGTEGNGVYIYDLLKKSITQFTTSKKLPTNTIRSLKNDKYGRIWIGTPLGLGYFENKTNLEYHNVQIKKKFSNVYLISITDSILYCGTAQGLVKIDIGKKPKLTTYYGINDGFEGVECSQNAEGIGLNNSVLIGTISGFSVMRPEFERKNITPPNLNFTHINLFYENILSSRLLENTVTFSPGQNHIGFKFSAIDLRNPEGILYCWKLSKLENKWSPLSSANEVNYTNLDPGKYTFSVQARNDNGIWTTHALEFKFEILSPWYKTMWFYVLAITSIIFILFLFYFGLTRNYRKRQQRERQKLLNENKILELQQMALRLQMNPHFIFNCLNSIQNLVNQNRNDDANFYIREFSGLMRGMVDLTPKNTISLEEELKLLINYLELEKLNRSNNFDYHIDIKLEDTSDFYKIPPLLLQPFAENAIVHGFKGKTDSGKINIVIYENEKELRIDIIDNGKGFETNPLINNKGSAIRITQNRLELYNLSKGEWVIFMHQENGTGTIVSLILKH